MTLERTAIPNNVLDRLDQVESTLADILANAITPQSSQGSGDDAAGVLSGWTIDGGVLRDAASLIVLDPGIPGIQVAAGGHFKSSDFVAGSAGFDINGGVAEFNNVTVRGTIYATVGAIGGWTIGATSLVAGSGANTVGLDSGGTNPAIYAGSATPGSAPFRVTKAGVLFAQGATIQSAASGARVVLDGTGIKGYDAATQRYELLNDGSGWLGDNTVFKWTNAGVVTLNGSAVMPNTILGGKVNFFNVPIVDGLVITNNSPTAGKVAWNSFTLTHLGVSYAIDAGNSANKFIYWKKATSTTVLQTSATPPAQAVDQFIVIFNEGGTGIASLFSNIVYADYISVVNLAAINAAMGNLTVDGTLSMATGGVLKSGQTAYDTGTGYWIEHNAGTPRLSIGNAAGNKLTWDGSTLSVTGTMTIGAGAIGGVTIAATKLYVGTGTWGNANTGFYLDNAGQFSLKDKLTWDGTTLNVKGRVVIGGSNAGYGVNVGEALLACRFDGPQPYNLNTTGNPNGHKGQVATASGGVIYRPGKFGKAVQIAEATTNLVKDPSFEFGDLTYWTLWGAGTATVTRSTARSVYGATSLRMSAIGKTTTYYQSATFTLLNGETAVASAYVFRTAAPVSRVLLYSQTASATRAYNDATLTNTWERVVTPSYTNSTGSTETLYVLLAVVAESDTYFDGIQTEKKAYVTPYCDGSLGAGHTWSGTAHASASSRVAADLSYAFTQSPVKGSVSFWYIPAFASSAWAVAVHLLDICNGTNRLADIYFVNGKWGAYDTVVAAELQSAATSFSADTPYHIVYAWDSVNGTRALYVNGALVASSTPTAWTPIAVTTLYVGRYSTALYADGIISDLFVLDRTLSADEVYALYASNAPVTVGATVNELRLAGANTGQVVANAGGIFGYDELGNERLALPTWDAVWGTRYSGGAALHAGCAVFGDPDGCHFIYESTGASVMIGDPGADNLYATGFGVALRYGAVERVTLSSDGLTINDSNGAAVITLSSAAGAEITKKLTMPGANSAIAIGSTPPTSAAAGTGLWLDRTGLYGLNANVVQAKFSATDGTIVAGAGAVVLNATGIFVYGVNVATRPFTWGTMDQITATGYSYINLTSINVACTIASIRFMYYVNSPNDGSNYWTIQLVRTDNDSAIYSKDTHAKSAATWYNELDAIGGGLGITMAMKGLYWYYTKTGSPGKLSIYPPNFNIG